MERWMQKINWLMTIPSLKVLVDWLFASKHLEHQLKMQILGQQRLNVIISEGRVLRSIF